MGEKLLPNTSSRDKNGHNFLGTAYQQVLSILKMLKPLDSTMLLLQAHLEEIRCAQNLTLRMKSPSFQAWTTAPYSSLHHFDFKDEKY